MGFVGGVKVASAGNKFEDEVVAFGFEQGRFAEGGGDEGRTRFGSVGFETVGRFRRIHVEKEGTTFKVLDATNSRDRLYSSIIFKCEFLCV